MKIELGIHGIVINAPKEGGAGIESDLKRDSGSFEDMQYDASMDAIESIILAHHLAGIDVTTKEYIEGIEIAIESCANHFAE